VGMGQVLRRAAKNSVNENFETHRLD